MASKGLARTDTPAPGFVKRAVRALFSQRMRPYIERIPLSDKVLEAFSDEIAAVAHKHLSLLAQELIPKIPDILTRSELASIYGTPYACLEDAQRIRAKNLAYDIIRLLTALGRP